MTAPSHYVLKSGNFSSHARILERIPAMNEHACVLDVGGGEGYLASALHTRGYQVTCLAAPGTVSPTISSAVAAGSSPRSVVMLRHILRRYA